MGKDRNNSKIIYSTNKDYQPNDDDNGNEDMLHPKSKILKVWIEKNGRGGKAVSVVKDFAGPEDELQRLCKLLKTKCGVGGTAKDGEILIQGDHRDKIIAILTGEGYQAKKAGG